MAYRTRDHSSRLHTLSALALIGVFWVALLSSALPGRCCRVHADE